ncbi:MAG: hypothetical protein M3P93_18505 [Actinomycetota bacterium]|nr:hypothetical protein [Actinomycetota bacterium]
MPQTVHRPSDQAAPAALPAALRDLYANAVPGLVSAAVLTTVRATLVILTAGLDQEARRNAWAATSEGAARARARREAEAALRAARVLPVSERTARAAH